MAVTLTIDAVSKTLQKKSLRFDRTANGSGTARFTVRSMDGSYVPAIDAEVILAEDGTRIFGGLVTRAKLLGPARGAIATIDTEITCGDFNAYTERRYVNGTLAAGTLKSMLTTLVDDYLDDYGVTLDGSQVDGPSLPALTFEYVHLPEVLNHLMTLTAEAGDPYVWNIDDFKVLSAAQPSASAAPFNIADDTPDEVIGDITVEESREQYANRIIIKVPPKQEVGRIETFDGDGSTDTFTLEYTLTKSYGIIHVYESDGVTPAGGETFGIPPDAPLQWEYDPDTNTITRTAGATAADKVYKLTFDGVLDAVATAQDDDEITANGIWEKVILIDAVPSGTTLQDLADGDLAKRIHPTKRVRFKTETSGFAPGQSMTITLPTRDLSAVTAVISDVHTRDHKLDALLHDVTAVIDGAQTNLGRGWRDVLKLWAGDKTGTSAPVTVGDGGPGQAGPAPPVQSVQFHHEDGGKFDGSANFTFDKDTSTVMIGTGHTIQ